MLACQTPVTHTGNGALSADALASPVTCHASDDFYFRSDGAVLSQPVFSGEETGTDLESSLESIAASTALFESLAGSAVMLDLYDVFANPSAFPFPPEVGADHASSSATPMDMDVPPATEFGAGGLMPAARCQPEVFASSPVSGHQLTMSGANGSGGGQSLVQMDMKSDAVSPSRHLSHCHGRDMHQDMDITDFRTTNGRGEEHLTSPGFSQESLLTQAPPRAVCPHHSLDLHRHHHHQSQPPQQQSPVYSPPRSGPFYAPGGFIDVSPPPPSSPPGHFRFPSAAATLGYRAFQQQQQQQPPHQRRRPELALMTSRICYALDMAPISPPISAGQITADLSDLSQSVVNSSAAVQSPATPTTPGSSISSSSSDVATAASHFAIPSPPHSAPASASALPPTIKTALTETKSIGAATGKDGLCAVCGDNAICQHYGVRTCEGCKGFFKRTVQKGAKYVCLANHNCVIDKRHRNRCQFCRFQKCLAVGMVREVVRTDSLKGRRGRLPSKPRSPSESPPSPPVSFITALVRAHVDTSPATPDLDYSQYRVPSEEEDLPMSTMIQQFYDCLIQSIDAVKVWADRVPGFSELCKHDQDQLFRTAALELVMLRIAYTCRLESGDDRIVFSNGLVLHQRQCLSTFGSDWLEAIADFGASLRRHAIDISTLACMAALALITYRHGLVEAKRVDDLQNRVLDALRDHCTYNAAGQRLLFARAIGLLPQLRTVSRLGVDRLRSLKHRGPADQPAAITPDSPELLAAPAAPLQSPL